MSLVEYRRKRDFSKTGEPKGASGKSKTGRQFVIQKHAASHLHFDFRLELDGTLKSWAVPKGPSLDAKVRVLAMQVEDHPIEYGSFEGIIPQGEYGGGTVMLWDQGTWEPDGDPKQGYAKGHLRFRLHGEKVSGGWTLARTRIEKGRAQWLLIKHDDEAAIEGDAYGLVQRENRSMLSGRTMEEIAADADRVWTKKGERIAKRQRTKSGKTAKSGPRSGAKKVLLKVKLPEAKSASVPKAFAPQLATLAEEVPDGDEWVHEMKFDGYRILALRDEKNIRLLTRNGNDWTDKFQGIAAALATLPFTGVVDGELVVNDEEGVSHFQKLQNAIKRSLQNQLVYYAFDLPYLNGYDIRQSPLLDRKEQLSKLILKTWPKNDGPIRFSDHIVGHGKDMLTNACRRGLEGIVSKRSDGIYESRRNGSWLKIKCHGRQEFVIGGYTKPGGSRSGFGSLLLGYYDRRGKLQYAGAVGTGFNHASLRELKKLFDELATDRPPYANDLPAEIRRKGITWVKPRLVCEIEFTEWTEEGVLRHPSFQGLREDKRAKDVVREMTTREGVIAKPKRASLTPDTGGRQTKRDPTINSGGATVAGVTITHPERLLYPGTQITKLDVARYYEEIADWVLPYIVDRPLTLLRCPEGQAGKCFYHKHWKPMLPSTVGKVMISEKGGQEPYVTISDLAGLISLVQISVLEMHPWSSKNDQLEHPDQIIFDLDPDPVVDWNEIRQAAKDLRALLKELDLESFVRTSGGKGLHVVVPLQRKNTWDEVTEFSHNIALGLARHAPDRFVANMRKDLRKGKIFVDYLRNQRGSTSVASYSTRNRSGAPVATPLAWTELPKILGPDAFTLQNVPLRLSRLRNDPWKGFFRMRQRLTKKMSSTAKTFA